MPAITPGADKTVLVTGANGFIAVWVVKDLLERGYTVRGTVRAEDKATHLRELFASYVKDGRLELVVVEDITKPGAFDDAVKGVHAIEHTASPFHFNADDPNELIEPAVKGTVGILESAVKNAGPQLARVVVLSSCASVSNPTDAGILDERNWNTANLVEVREKGRGASQLAKYRASKSLAEKSAWDFVEAHKGEIAWDLVTLCPPFVFGPILHAVPAPSALNTSVADFYNNVLAHAKKPEQLAAFQGSWVDVRDLSLAHVRAIEVDAAAGQRFIVSSGNFTWQDWFDTTNALDIPDARAPEGTPGAGARTQFQQVYNAQRARTVLEITFRDKAATARDSVASFRERGWVPVKSS